MHFAKPVLLTGAAGALGSWLRPQLLARYGALVSSDIAPIDAPLPGETFIQCDLADGIAVERLVSQAGPILHFGGQSVEAPFHRILASNILGTYNVFESARRNGNKRIVFASSNHVIGFHETTTRLDADSVMKPDGYYGVSKAFGENLGSLYVDKHGLEIACLRIGTSIPEPKDARHLATWLAYEDLFSLLEACLAAPTLGFEVIYGASANDRGWWDNSKTKYVHWTPKDNAERFAAKLLPNGDQRNPADIAVRFQGGPFCSQNYDRQP